MPTAGTGRRKRTELDLRMLTSDSSRFRPPIAWLASCRYSKWAEDTLKEKFAAVKVPGDRLEMSFPEITEYKGTVSPDSTVRGFSISAA